VLEEAWNLLSDDAKAICRIAESNLDALNTVDLGPKRPFSVVECALWARLTGPRFAAQVAAVVSLVEAPSNCSKAAAVAKEAITIKYGNKTSHSITEFSEAPFASKHPKLIQKGTKAAEALPCVSNTINNTSKTLATSGGDMLYYLNEPRAMKELAARASFMLVKLPATPCCTRACSLGHLDTRLSSKIRLSAALSSINMKPKIGSRAARRLRAELALQTAIRQPIQNFRIVFRYVLLAQH